MKSKIFLSNVFCLHLNQTEGHYIIILCAGDNPKMRLKTNLFSNWVKNNISVFVDIVFPGQAIINQKIKIDYWHHAMHTHGSRVKRKKCIFSVRSMTSFTLSSGLNNSSLFAQINTSVIIIGWQRNFRAGDTKLLQFYYDVPLLGFLENMSVYHFTLTIVNLYRILHFWVNVIVVTKKIIINMILKMFTVYLCFVSHLKIFYMTTQSLY